MPTLSGDPSLFKLIALTAFCNSCSSVFAFSRSSSRPRCCCCDRSSLSELSAESGGVVTAPVGIRLLFTGGGDWRTLPLGAKS